MRVVVPGPISHLQLTWERRHARGFQALGRSCPMLQQRMPESEEAMDENCQRIKKLLDLYRDGRLTDEQKADVEYHLLYCPECMFLLTLVPSLNPE